MEKHIARNDPGINQIDIACKEHAILYTIRKHLSQQG